MIIKIDNDEREKLERVCATFDLPCRIFTMENNPLLVQAEITHSDGGELSAATSWYLCACVYTKMQIKNL